MSMIYMSLRVLFSKLILTFREIEWNFDVSVVSWSLWNLATMAYILFYDKKRIQWPDDMQNTDKDTKSAKSRYVTRAQ